MPHSHYFILKQNSLSRGWPTLWALFNRARPIGKTVILDSKEVKQWALSLQAVHPTPSSRMRKCKLQQTLKPLEGRSSCLNVTYHVVQDRSESTTRQVPRQAMYYHSSATESLPSSSTFIAISKSYRVDHLSWITVAPSESLIGDSMERSQLCSGLGLTLLLGGLYESHL